jgi:hypothetical protein
MLAAFRAKCAGGLPRTDWRQRWIAHSSWSWQSWERLVRLHDDHGPGTGSVGSAQPGQAPDLVKADDGGGSALSRGFIFVNID